MASSMTTNDDLLVIDECFKPVEEILAEAGLEKHGGPTFWGTSFWRRAKLCPYDGLLIHRDGFEPAKKQALIVGILFHVAMAFWYTSRDRSQALRVCQVILDWCRNALNRDQDSVATWPSELWGFAQAAQNLVMAYIASWPQALPGRTLTIPELQQMDPPQQDVLMVERDVYALPPQSKFPVSVRYDIVWRAIDPVDGAVCVVIPDHKTTRNDSPEWREAWWQDDQLMALQHVWKTVMEPLGWPPVRAVMINTIEKPRSRNDLPAFERHLFPLRPDRLSVWAQQMFFSYLEWQQWEQIAASKGIDWRHVKQNWASCFQRKFEVCPRLSDCLTLRDMNVYEPPQVPVASTSPAIMSASVSLSSNTKGTQEAQPSPAAVPQLPAPSQDSAMVSPPVVAGSQPAAAPAPSCAFPMIAQWQIEKLTELVQSRGLPPDWKPTTYAALCDFVFTEYQAPLTDMSADDAQKLIACFEAAPESKAPPAIVTTSQPLVGEPQIPEQAAALEAARVKAGWTFEQVYALAAEMFKKPVVKMSDLDRQQMKALILQVLDAAAAIADDVVDVAPLAAELASVESLGKDLAALTGHASDGIVLWLTQANETMLREYASRFVGRGDRFQNITSLEGLRIEILKVSLEEVQAQIASAQQPAPPPERTFEEIQQEVLGCKKWKPIGFHARKMVTVTEAVTGQWYLVRGVIAMATPRRTDKERTFVLPDGTPLGVAFMKDDTTPNTAVPSDMARDDLGVATPPEAKVDENGNPVTPQPVAGAEPGLPRQVGEAAKPTGVVPVFWLGHHKRQQKAKDMQQSLWKEKGDCFGLALCGKAAETEKLKAFTFVDGVACETAAKSVGSAIWEHFGKLVQGL